MAEEDPSVSIDISADTRITFKDWESLLRWLEKERAKWDWLARGDGLTDAHNWSSAVQNHFDNIFNEIARLRREENSIATAAQPLSNFQASGQLIPSDSENGSLILDIRESAGAAAAAFAYAFLKKAVTLNNVRTPDEFRGAVLTAIPDMRQPTEFSARLQRERTNYKNAVRSAIDKLDLDEKAREQSTEALIATGKEIARRALRNHFRAWKRAKEGWQKSANQAVVDIKAVEAAYVESMGLQAPVQYWTIKAGVHKAKERSAIIRLLVFFPAVVLVLGLAFWKAAELILGHPTPADSQVPVALYVVITGGLAVLSTLGFWIGRLFTKLYLSEHHLRNDAEERAVMTTTYLALTRERAADETDRQIVLNALFRTTPDGIVRDEGPSDLSLQALVARLLVR